MRVQKGMKRFTSPAGAAGAAAALAFAAGLLVAVGHDAAGAAAVLAAVGVALASARREATRRAFAARLAQAAGEIGEEAFVRPVVGALDPALDAVASAMARRSDHLRRSLGELEQVRRGFDAVFSALPCSALLVDGDGRVRRINPAASERFRIRPEQAAGLPLLQVVRENQIEEAVRAVLNGKEGVSCVIDVAFSGQAARLCVQVEPIRGEHGAAMAGAVLLLFDITRLHHLEQVRREFVANLSHELRTPITSIKGFVETLLEGEAPAEVQTRFLNILKEEAERLEALARDLLDLSFVESDAGPLKREPVDLHELAVDVLALLDPQIQKKRIAAEVHMPPGLPAVPAHRGMLEQVLVNLVDNAVKYSPEGSRVSIEARRVAVDHIELVVADNGPGIASDHLPRLFERFYRVDKSRSRSEGGSGLGLSIVRHIVERHGGSVRAESRLGKGSRFIVTLPLREEEAP